MEGPDPLAVTSHAARVVARLRAAGCVFAEAEAELLLADAAAPEDVAESVRRRVSGTPLEHILGWAEFAGQRILVESGVFVPRRRTELLVGEATRLLSFLGTSQSPLVVDLCCGSPKLNCTRRTSIHWQCAVRGGTCCRSVGPCTKATCSTPCLRGFAAGFRCWP